MSLYKPPWSGKWGDRKQQRLHASELFQARGVVRTPYFPRDIIIIPGASKVVITWRKDASNPGNLVTKIYKDVESGLHQELPAGVFRAEIPGTTAVPMYVFLSFAAPGGGSESRKIALQCTPA